MTTAETSDIENPEHPVRVVNSGAGSLPASARWDDLRVAMALDESGSFRRTADSSGVTINTVRARLDRLEAAVGVRLFRRSPKGVIPTPAGNELIAEARRIQSRVGQVEIADAPPLVSPGELRIGASEALGVLWMAPRLSTLQDRIPASRVNLLCSYDLLRDRSLEIDIEVGFKRSESPDMVSARLATVHFVPFAAQRYIDRHGAPAALLDLTRHRIIELVAPGIHSQILDFLVGTGHEQSFKPLRTNSGMAMLSAVESGEGIGFMPTYAASLGRGLVALDLPVQLRFDIFLSYASDLRHATPIIETVLWLREIFHPGRSPWFAEHFVHPRDVERHAAMLTIEASGLLDNSIR